MLRQIALCLSVGATLVQCATAQSQDHTMTSGGADDTATVTSEPHIASTPYQLTPASVYRTHHPAVPLEDRETALIEAVWHASRTSCLLDGSLTVAARKHADDLARHAVAADAANVGVVSHPFDYLKHALRLAGNIDYSVVPIVFSPTDEGVVQAAEELLQQSRPFSHCGIGFAQFEGKARAVFLGVRRAMKLAPIAVSPDRGKRIQLAGSVLDVSVRDVQVFLAAPSGDVKEIEAFVIGSKRFNATVSFPQVGIYTIEVQLQGSFGAESAAIFPLYVGVAREMLPEVLPELDHGDMAPARMMSQLVNRVRRNSGLPPLVRDASLEKIALAHSRDMVNHHFFGHSSPRTGQLAERLDAARVSFSMAAENVGQGASLVRVHHNLLESPSHKMKLLNADMTHLGIGIVKHDNLVTVTQVFIRR